MEVNNNSINIEDVDMMELDQEQFINRNYCNLESKVKVLDYLKEYKVSPYKASEAFKNKYSVWAIYKWKKKENLIRETAIKKPKNLTVHKGKRIKYEEIEEKLIEYITININAKNPLTIWIVGSYYHKLVPENINENYKAKYQRIYRLLKKYGFCIRKPTRQGHLFPLDSHIKISVYLKDLFELRSKCVKDISLIINMDETPIFFTPELNGVISYKGAKQVVVSTQDQEKPRLTIVLSIAGNGAKLKPYLIFCGSADSQILYNRIYEIPFFKKKSIL